MATTEEKVSEVMNLIGYGLAKFDKAFLDEFNMPSQQAFGRFIVELGLAKTVRAVLSRMDSFDPYFDNGRRGWHQRNQRKHIKLFIDSLFGNEDAHGFANIVKMYIHEINPGIILTTTQIAPAMKSKFKQLQETGKEAEFYFINNYRSVPIFVDGVLMKLLVLPSVFGIIDIIKQPRPASVECSRPLSSKICAYLRGSWYLAPRKEYQSIGTTKART